LPTLIGPTENSLRALLTHTLAVTQIDGYDEWVYLNMTDGGAAVEQIAIALRRPRDELDELAIRLQTRGLLISTAELTQVGQGQLKQGRALVNRMTEKLTTDLEPEQQRICAEVLDIIRMRADRELASVSTVGELGLR
jgi:urease accessory protein UreF